MGPLLQVQNRSPIGQSAACRGSVVNDHNFNLSSSHLGPAGVLVLAQQTWTGIRTYDSSITGHLECNKLTTLVMKEETRTRTEHLSEGFVSEKFENSSRPRACPCPY